MPPMQGFHLDPLDKRHDREGFTCGVPSLDSYLKAQASQDMRRKANAVFAVAPLERPREIAGFFTLCAYGVAPGAVPEQARKRIPRYPVVSATLIGKLAVRLELQGRPHRLDSAG